MSRLATTVGINARRIRSAAGISQEELADRCGLHRTYIGGIERGERNISLLSLERLADALDVEPATLISTGSASADDYHASVARKADRA